MAMTVHFTIVCIDFDRKPNKNEVQSTFLTFEVTYTIGVMISRTTDGKRTRLERDILETKFKG